MLRMVQAILPAIVIIGAWELGAWFLFDPRFVGKPSDIFLHFIDEIVKPGIWADTAITFWEILLGYVIGAITGGALGFVLGFRPRLARIVEPYILIISAIPKIAIAPIIIIALGIGIQSKVAIVVSMVFFLMFYAVFSGVKQIEPDFIHQARIMGASRGTVIAHIVMPAIAPNIFDGLKTSIIFAVIGALIGEFIAAKAGLGFYILNASGAFNINGIWVGVILIIALVFALTTIIGVVERRVLRWLPDLGSGKGGI
jgi:NitT/TauT family transport system permease protein